MIASPVTFQPTEDQTRAVNLLGGPAKFIMLFGGSRSGKTFISICAIVARALSAPGSRHVILRFAFAHVKQSVWYDTFPKVMKLVCPRMQYKENKQDWFVKFHNGSEIWFGGLDDKERTEKILGNEYATIYYNEASQISYGSVQLALTRLAQRCIKNDGTPLRNKAYFDCNPPGKSHWTYKLFIKGEDPLSQQKVNANLYACMLMNPEGNRQNLSEDYIETVLDSLSEAQRNRFKYGLWTDDDLDTLFKEQYIQKYRVTQAPALRRIVVAIDPAVSANKDSDETGIVVAGIGYDGHGYVLEDSSGLYTPLMWGNKVSTSYHYWKADKAIAEVNQGGDLVEANIKSVDKTVSLKKVHAKRGKALRAEPVVALYEQGKIHHVGLFPALESQMTSWNPSEEDSPDRVDALVYAITELMIQNTSSSWVL